MISPLAAVLMTAIASTLASTPAADTPARGIDAPAQGFSASFPAPPQVTGHAPAGDNDAGYWIYAARSGGGSWAIRVDQYPSDIRVPAPDQRTYDLLLRAHAGESASRLQAVKTVQVAGLPGREGDFVNEKGDSERVRVVMVGRRIYQVSYAAGVGGGEQGDAFLTSFQIDAR